MHCPRFGRLLATLLLVVSCGIETGVAQHATPRDGSQERHDISHPLVLATEADFLAALIALHEESLEASLVAKTRVRSIKVRDYAKRAAPRHRDEIARLRKLLARYDNGTKPDFHFEPRMAGLRNLSGAPADRYYLAGLGQLMAAKIELAEFATGTVKSREIRQLAERVIETKSDELVRVSRWARAHETR